MFAQAEFDIKSREEKCNEDNDGFWVIDEMLRQFRRAYANRWWELCIMR